MDLEQRVDKENSEITPLSIDECLNLMEKETAEFERQLKKRQLEIVMRLKQNNCTYIPPRTIEEIANAMIIIVRLKLYGIESVLTTSHNIDKELIYNLTNINV